jgi:uncharacterized membrane protein
MTSTSTPAVPAQPIQPGRGYAIASFILGLLPVVPIAGPIVAIVLGHLSRKDARSAGAKPSPLAAWGIALGWLSIALTIILIVAFAIGAAKTGQDLSNLPADAPTFPAQ